MQRATTDPRPVAAPGTPVPGSARAAVLRRWAWVPLLAVGIGSYEAVRAAVVDTGNPALVPALLVVGAAVVPVSFVAFVAGRRLRFGVGAWVVCLTALLSGVVGVVTAGLLEYETLRSLGAVPLVLVGVIEEAAKLVVPLVVLVVAARPRRAADGLLIGVASGAGFAVLETMGYGFVALLESRGDLAVVDDVLFDRGLLSPAAHMAWTGIAAAALWRAAEEGLHLRSAARVLLAFAVAVGLHALWDADERTWGYVALAVVSLGLLTWTAHRLARTPSPRRPPGASGGGQGA